MRSVLTAALVTVALAAWAAAEEPAANPVEAALRKPPATGLLITFVSSGGQCQQRGVKPGDVLVSYGGTATPTTQALVTAKQAADLAKKPVALVLQRRERRVEIEVDPGPLGIDVAPVTQGKPAAPLPKATLKTLDYAQLGKTRREVWYRFAIAGKQVGFEHGVLTRKDGVLTLRHEVGFDGGERWGKNHQTVDVEVRTTKTGLVPWLTRYTNVLNGWSGEGGRFEAKGEAPSWAVVWKPVDGEPVTRRVALPADLPIFPTYLVAALVELMPRAKGACLHYRPLNEGMGTVGPACALYVTGQEPIRHDGADLATWKIQLRALGGSTKATWWVDDEGQAVRIDYGGARAHRSTKAKVLKGLPKGITPGASPPGR